MYLSLIELSLYGLTITLIFIVSLCYRKKLRSFFIRNVVRARTIYRRLKNFSIRKTVLVLKKAIKLLSVVSERLSVKRKMRRPLYEDLTPNPEADRDRTYQDALRWALSNKNIRNIALTGPYGSGKSSIIRSFQKNNRQFEYLELSLATFDQESPETNVLELNILYQIFYYAKPKRISQSRYKRIEILSPTGIILRSLGLLVSATAVLYLIKPMFFDDIPFIKEMDSENKSLLFLCAYFLAGSTFVIAVIWIFRAYHNHRVSKLNVASGEMEVGEKKESVLNGHLDEILYFFEVSRYDVVFIEDLDRFSNTVDIFTKLREINLLINNAHRVKRNVVFIYALRDELFEPEHRTKFFDFIIPVIPVIDSNNSKDMLTSKLEKIGLKNKIPKDFIAYIAYYIDDMRLLLNIINEFILYQNKLLRTFDLKADRLLGIIVYKNLCAKDFAKLHKKDGIVYHFFAKKNILIKQTYQHLIDQHDEKDDRIDALRNEQFRHMDELRKFYLFNLLTFIEESEREQDSPGTVTGRVEMDDKMYTLGEIAADESLCETLFSSDEISYEYFQSVSLYTRTVDFQFEALETASEQEERYEHRENILRSKAAREEEELKTDLAAINQQINEHKHLSIREAVALAPKIMEDEIFNDQPIISYLIRRGFLDEQYASYISLFHAGNLTSEDKNFLIGVQHQFLRPVDFKLTNVAELLENLSDYDFGHAYIFNFDLLDELLAHRQKHQEKLKKMLAQLTNGEKEMLDFITRFLMEGKNNSLFMQELVAIYTPLWDDITNKSNLSSAEKLIILRLLLQHIEAETIAGLDDNKSVSTMIVQYEEFLNWLENEKIVEKGLDALLAMDIKVRHIDFQGNKTEILDYLYKNNLYEISEANIRGFITMKNIGEKSPELEKAHLTSVFSSNCTELIDYIKKEPAKYAKNVFLELDNNTEETAESLLYLLNNTKIDVPTCQKIIDKQPRIFLDLLEDTVDEVYPYLLTTRKVVCHLQNIYTYQRILGFDITLNDYLNAQENHTILSKQKLVNIAPEDARSFYLALMLNINLNAETLKAMLKTCRFRFKEIDLKEVPEDNIKVIIQAGKLELTKENLSLLTANAPKKAMLLVEHYKTQFIKKTKELKPSASIYTEIFGSEKFSLEEKSDFAVHIDTTLFDWSQTTLASTVLFHVAKVPSISFGLLIAIAKYSLDNPSKFNLINKFTVYLSQEQIKQLMTALGHPFSRLAYKRSSIMIDNCDYHLTFGELLISKELKGGPYLSSIKLVKDGKMIKLNAKAK